MASSDADIVYVASCITGSISLFASYLTIRIVLLMKMNGYLQLVTSLAIVQVFVDLGHIMTFQNRMATDNALCQTHGIFLIFGNLSATLWTNFISLSVFYIIFFGRSLDIKKHYRLFFVIANILPLILAICASALHYIVFSTVLTSSCFLPPVKPASSIDDDITDDQLYYARDQFSRSYNDLHYVSLGINALIAVITYVKIFFFNTSVSSSSLADIGRVSMLSLQSTLSLAGAGKPSRRQLAMKTLALRLILYPAAEIFNELFRVADSATGNTIFALNLLHAIINGLLGTVFFLIFLSMQPKARVLLYNMRYNFCYPSIWGERKSPSTNDPVDNSLQINSHHVSWNKGATELIQPLSSTPFLADMDEDELASEIQNPTNTTEDDTMRGSIRDSVRESEMNGSSVIRDINAYTTYGIHRITDHTTNSIL